MRSLITALILTVPIAAAAAGIQATAEQGKAVLQQQNCTKCHAIAGAGATVSASALQRPLDREYTPAGLVATLWNHAPTMWSTMAASNIPVPKISEEDAANVFTYFASLRYFEPMGDAGRGSRTFVARGCKNCHVEGVAGKAVPVTQWQTISDPIALISALWNHIPQMRDTMAARHIKWPELTARDLSDIVLYARSFPAARKRPVRLELPPLEGGESLAESYGCKTCHTGTLDFDSIMTNRTLTDVAAAMWNHGPKLQQNPAQIPPEEMRKLLGSVWARQFLKPTGDPVKGRKVAETKKCAGCHDSGPGPSFSSLPGPYTVVKLTSALWAHGPVMLDEMKRQKVEWPRLSPIEVENLVAYMNSPASSKRHTAAVRQ